jgi:hypothetical protein
MIDKSIFSARKLLNHEICFHALGTHVEVALWTLVADNAFGLVKPCQTAQAL